MANIERYRMADRIDQRVDAAQLVDRMLGEMTPIQRIVASRLMLGMDQPSIAKDLGTSQQAIYSILHTMRVKFKGLV